MERSISYSVYDGNTLLYENISADEVLETGKILGFRRKGLEKLLKTNNKRFGHRSRGSYKITKNFPVVVKRSKPRGPQILTSAKVVDHLANGSYLFYSSFLGNTKLITPKRTIAVPKELLDWMLRTNILEIDVARSTNSIYRTYYTLKDQPRMQGKQISLFSF